MDHFTPLASTTGGILLGLSATVLLLFNGRIAGISGILAGSLFPYGEREWWRVAFVVGLLVTGIVTFHLAPALFTVRHHRTLPTIAVAGFLVGLGVRLGAGCTSGHGICGLSRLSPRSFVAVGSFMVAGAATVFAMRAFGGAT